MQRTQPLFHADVVGSLLRPAAIKQARQHLTDGEIDAAKQRARGLQVVTDGEFSRTWWQMDFFEGLDGVEGYQQPDHGIQFQGLKTKARSVKVTGKLGFLHHPMLANFRFLKSLAGDAVPKMTIPSPSVLHFRGGRAAIDKAVLPRSGGILRRSGTNLA